MKKYFTQKNILIALVLLLLVMLVIYMYRLFFQFNRKDIGDYINEEAVKYQNKAGVAKLLGESVEHILRSHSLTSQVLTSAKDSGTPKEQELVQAAINQCKSFGYLG